MHLILHLLAKYISNIYFPFSLKLSMHLSVLLDPTAQHFAGLNLHRATCRIFLPFEQRVL